MNNVRIMLAAATAEDRKLISGLLEDESLRIVSAFRPDNDGLRKAGTQPADVLLIGTSGKPESEFDFAERLYTTRNDITIFLLTAYMDAKTIARAMESGITRVLDINGNENDIKTQILTVLNVEQNRRKNTQTAATYDSRVVACYSPKGGAGKTTLAVNLACALASLNKKVALIDLNLQFGNVGVFLDIARGDTIADMVEEHSFEPTTIKSYLVRHQSGVMVMLSSSAPEYAELIKAEHIELIISSLRSEFDYVILDMDISLGDCAIASFEAADTILFVVNADIATLLDAKRGIKVLEALNVQDKIQLIVNKAGISAMKAKEVSGLLEVTPSLIVPYDLKAAMMAVNRGVPMLDCMPGSKASKAISAYAKSLARTA